ncbi:MAG: hypothetical protein L0271_16835 [Gemmatimonadetes bacterium]|nr:hypothetical protein [Gemmatimonadota bacterium]
MTSIPVLLNEGQRADSGYLHPEEGELEVHVGRGVRYGFETVPRPCRPDEVLQRKAQELPRLSGRRRRTAGNQAPVRRAEARGDLVAVQREAPVPANDRRVVDGDRRRARLPGCELRRGAFRQNEQDQDESRE